MSPRLSYGVLFCDCQPYLVFCLMLGSNPMSFASLGLTAQYLIDANGLDLSFCSFSAGRDMEQELF